MSAYDFDVYEAAALMGARDAMKKQPLREAVFTYHSQTAKDLRLIYELAYFLEKESNMLLDSTEFEVLGHIVEFNDSTGWGTVRFDHFGTIETAQFSYQEMDESLWGEIDQPVTVFYKHTDHGIKVIKLVQPVSL